MQIIWMIIVLLQQQEKVNTLDYLSGEYSLMLCLLFFFQLFWGVWVFFLITSRALEGPLF